MLRIFSQPKDNDITLDFFAGSGTTGAAAAELGRRFVLADNNEQAIKVMEQRFAQTPDVVFHRGICDDTDQLSETT